MEPSNGVFFSLREQRLNYVDKKAIASLGLAFSETNRHLMTDSEVWELVES